MIIVRITSGLGNQMFQYNFYRYLKEKYKDTKVLADVTWFYSNNDHHGYELERIFSGVKDSGFEIEKAGLKEITHVTGQLPALVSGPLAKKIVFLEGPVNRILRERFHTTKNVNRIDQLDGDISNKSYIDENGKKVNPIFEAVNNLDITKDWYITGFWIEESYHRERLNNIRKELIFPDFTDDANKGLEERIRNVNSVSIHVRRGDYLSDVYSSMFKCLGEEYYKKAVELIKVRVQSPEFFIFSDDAEYIDKAFSWLDNRTIVDVNRGDDSYKDMQLMSLCRHNIIANSTFSQWGALLNKNPGAMVIYPSAYLRDEDTEIKSLPGWIRV